MKNQLVFTEVINICFIYSQIINDIRELSRKTKDIKATTIDGNIHNDKHFFYLLRMKIIIPIIL
ncbi:hypothetical protein WG83_06235 [Proteus mirabilis]|nr:hypothetical protein WG83_06235 [Proteus mirabilis]